MTDSIALRSSGGIVGLAFWAAAGPDSKRPARLTDTIRRRMRRLRWVLVWRIQPVQYSTRRMNNGHNPVKIALPALFGLIELGDQVFGAQPARRARLQQALGPLRHSNRVLAASGAQRVLGRGQRGLAQPPRTAIGGSGQAPDQ